MFRRRTAVAAALALGLLAPALAVRPSSAARVLVVAPGGSGTACTAAAPCGRVDAAYRQAGPGDAIELAGGDYPNQHVGHRAEAAGFATNVVLRPRAGARVFIPRIDIYGPRLTVRGIRVTSGFLWRGADHGRFEEMVVDDVLSIAGADHTAIVRSRLVPAVLDATPILVGPENPGERVPHDVLIEDNEIGPAYASDLDVNPDTHNNALMVRGVNGLVIRRNLLLEGGTSSTLQVSNTMGPVTNALVENNFILGCEPRTERGRCRSFVAVQANGDAPLTTVIRNNTIRGTLYVQDPDAVSFRGNILTKGTACYPTMTHNLIGPGLFTDCPTSNRTGVLPIFAADGWHLAPGSPGVDFGVPDASPTDYDGDRRDGRPDAGADELLQAEAAVQGFTWLLPGGEAGSGPSGSLVVAYATQARPNTEYRLVTATGSCDTDVRDLHGAVRRSSSSGLIGLTAGRVDRPPGSWQVCFRAVDGTRITLPARFTVS